MTWSYCDRIIESVVSDYVKADKKLAVIGTMMVGRTTMVSQYPRKIVRAPAIGEKVDYDTVIMRPMSLFESKESNGDVSIATLFDGEPLPDSSSDISVYELCRIMCRGGWPVMLYNGRQLGKNALDYLNLVGDLTIPLAISKHISETASFSEVVRSTEHGMARVAADQRLAQLKQMMVVENIPSWNIGVRPGDRLLTRDQWCFVDPSIYCALADLRPAQMDKFRKSAFPAFFNLVVRDIRVYITRLKGELFHYCTRTKFDGGTVIQLEDGRWALMGMCFNPECIEEIASRMKVVMSADSDHGAPVFGMIVVPNGTTKVRDDGIYVVPIGCLGC